MAYNNVENFLKDCKPERYNFEWECDCEEYLKLSPLARYLTYKATGEKTRKNGKSHEFSERYNNGEDFCIKTQENEYLKNLADSDGSGRQGNNNLIHDVYEKLWCAKKIHGSTWFTLPKFTGQQFGGDTMNSVAYILCDIVRGKIEEPAYEKLKNKKASVRAKTSICYLLESYADKETSDDLLQLVDGFRDLSTFINTYHTLGNFVLVPAYFNCARGFKLTGRQGKLCDDWGKSLQYLKDTGFGDFKPADYICYINYFFLWDYVNNNGDADALWEFEKSEANGEWDEHLQTILERIIRRGRFMTIMLELQQELGEKDYCVMMESIFLNRETIYRDYTEALEAIKSYLVERNLVKNEWSTYFEKATNLDRNN